MRTDRIFLKRDGYLATLLLNRPERHNAFDAGMWRELETCVSRLENNPGRAVVITGADDKAFCAGFDVNPDNPHINGLATAVAEGNREPVQRLLQETRSIVDRLTGLPVPVIAAVNGDAHGGGAELAVRCDMRVMDPAASLCFSEVRLGLMPDWGGSVALTRLVGPALAADMVLTARRITAEEAHAKGLANRISAPGQALAEGIALAGEIAANGPRAVRHALDVIRQVGDLSLAAALDLETRRAAALIASGECLEGIGAFLEQRAPVFASPPPPKRKS
jgi:enoyl-CoA hydratase/carnithine racemase